MPDLSDVHNRMASLAWKMARVRERTARIATIVAHEQHSAAAMVPPTRGVGRTRRLNRLAYWADQVRAHGWPDGYAG